MTSNVDRKNCVSDVMLEIVVFSTKNSTINNSSIFFKFYKFLHDYSQIIHHYFLQILCKSVEI